MFYHRARPRTVTRTCPVPLRAGYRFENDIEVDAHALRASSNTEFDGDFVNESESIQQVIGGTIRFSPIEIWQLTLAAGRSPG